MNSFYAQWLVESERYNDAQANNITRRSSKFPPDQDWLDVKRLEFHEEQFERTQEVTLRWSDDGGQSYQLIVRQQFNFSPPQTTSEIEDYSVDLDGVMALELRIDPDISGSNIRASLAGLHLA